MSDEAKGTFTEKIEQANPNFLNSALDTTACAAFIKESRMKCAEATKLHRKFGNCEVTVKIERLKRQAFELARQFVFLGPRDQLGPVEKSFRQVVSRGEQLALANGSGE